MNLSGKILFALAAVMATAAEAAVTLPMVFGDNMVLQQGQKVPVWGWAAAGERVTVSFGGQAVETRADAAGKWRVALKPMDVNCSGCEFRVEGENAIVFTNVVVGEVWVCSGQSNMEFTMSANRKVKDWQTEIAAANMPLIRHFHVPHKVSDVPLDDVELTTWVPTTPETIPPQSAVAYFFGETVHKSLRAPVGLINCSWGGTRIEPWIPAAHKDDLWMLQHQQDWKRPNWVPTALWNGMVSGLVPFAIKGMVWYQGCANVKDGGDAYLAKTAALVRGWRREWNQGDFPYFLVQLAPFSYKEPNSTFLSEFQQAQAKVETIVPNSGYTVINDVGNPNDIHPTDKRTVGERVAHQVLDRVYGQFVHPWRTPTLKDCRAEGKTLRVAFDNADGLATRDGLAPSDFEVCGPSGAWVRAEARIDGSSVVLAAEGVADIRGMRFAPYNASTPNLVNGDGLPAGPCSWQRKASDAQQPTADEMRNDPLRPQFHFTAPVGRLNDPNGLSYMNGEWHLMYQLNPFGLKSERKGWGHAVAKDLVHWKVLPDTFVSAGEPGGPDYVQFFSGTAAIDDGNRAGFGKGAQILAYTFVTPKNVVRDIRLAWSLDGRHYTQFEGNPVVEYFARCNRDPKLLWHEPSRSWVLLVYAGGVGTDGRCGCVVFRSPDMKRWTRTGVIDGDLPKNVPGGGRFFNECPELVEIPVAGETGTRWVRWGGNGEYEIGDFDGFAFKTDCRVKPTWLLSTKWNRAYYAALTFAGAPDGRIVWMPWMGGGYVMKSDVFDQMMGLPCDLSLKRTPEGLRLAWTPVRELQHLRDGKAVSFDQFKGELVEAIVEADVGADGRIALDLRGTPVTFDAAKGEIQYVATEVGPAVVRTPWKLEDGKLRLRIFVDRRGIEIYSMDGFQVLPIIAVLHDRKNLNLGVTATGDVRDLSATAYRLKSIYE